MGKLPNDPELENMNPVLKLWMYENWIEDQNDKVELVKNHAYLVGSFINPEAVRQLTGDGMVTHVSSEEEFEQSLKMVLEDSKKEEQEKKVKKRRRRKLKA